MKPKLVNLLFPLLGVACCAAWGWFRAELANAPISATPAALSSDQQPDFVPPPGSLQEIQPSRSSRQLSPPTTLDLSRLPTTAQMEAERRRWASREQALNPLQSSIADHTSQQRPRRTTRLRPRINLPEQLPQREQIPVAPSTAMPDLGSQSTESLPLQQDPEYYQRQPAQDSVDFVPPSPGPAAEPRMAPRSLPTPTLSGSPMTGVLGPATVGHGLACPCGCQPRCTTMTVMVPTWETRYVNSVQTRYRQELRQRRFQKYYTVYDRVPQVETYTVQVPEPRTRTYTVNVPQAFQEPVEENYTIMVPEPRQREESVDREEAYRVPVETPYTVMVPERQAYQETTYKTVTEREEYQEKYVVQVPKTKQRTETTYEKFPLKKTVRKPVVTMQTETLRRPKVTYRSEVRTRKVTEQYYEYVTREVKIPVERFRNEPRQRTVQETDFRYEQRTGSFDVFEFAQEALPVDKEINYIDYQLEREVVDETYYVNEPYEETVTVDIPIRIQTPRTVTKTYNVKIPETTHVVQPYTVQVPYETMETQYRTVTQQVPVTKYRTITRDLGRWERKQVTCPTCQIFQDQCGCSSCLAGSQTHIQNVWCPRIVTQRIPYTDFRDVQVRIPYQRPKVLQRNETRTRYAPVTRYRTEQRTAQLQVYDYQNSLRQQSFKVTKYRWVAKTRPRTQRYVVESTKTKTIPFLEYREIRTRPKTIQYIYKEPVPIQRQRTENYMARVPYDDDEIVKVTEPVLRERTRTEEFTVRVPETIWETYQQQVPVTTFREVEETEYVEVPKVKVVDYTEMQPEIRTRTKYRNVTRKVPVFETKYKTEMVPQIKTRTTYRTETRTVTDKVMKTYMVAVPEVRTRTVYKTRYRDVPQQRTELYWVDVPQTRYRVKWVQQARQVAREHLQTYSVNIPYQVNVSVPVQVCRMVARTITVPVEDCCPSCGGQFEQLREVSAAYLKYGSQQVRSGLEQIRGVPWLRPEQ